MTERATPTGQARTTEAKAWRQRSQLATGVAVVCGLFLTETMVAHRTAPHPASPVIWSALGGVAFVALLVAWHAHRRARHLARAAAQPASDLKK